MLEVPSKIAPDGKCATCRVLHGGHAAYILIETVEKPTDNRLASLLHCGRVDADSSETISPSLARRTSHTPLLAPGPEVTLTKVPGPRAEGRDWTFANKTPIPPDKKGHHEGDRGRERMSYRVEPHAVGLRIRSGIGWTKKWPSVGYC
jgi:hypothetical protein